MKNIFLLIILSVILTGCNSTPKTTEQPCKWLINEKTLEYYEYCK